MAFTKVTPPPYRFPIVNICLASLLVFACQRAPEAPPQRLDVSVGGESFSLELALDDAARVKGLSSREVIDSGGGMLFAFAEPAVQRFWMRRCLVPIDLIYLDPGGRVVATYRMQPQPDTPDERLRMYSSKWPAQYAIELAGGSLDRLDVPAGTVVSLPVSALKRWVR